MPREDRTSWKSNYFLKIIQLLDEYPKCFIVGADNVGSKQMQAIHPSVCACGARPSCSWAKTPWWERPSVATWKTTRLWRGCFPTFAETWASSSPRRIWLRSGICCWQTKCPLLPMLVPSPHVRWPSRLRTPGSVQRRPPSSRLWESPPRSPEEPLKSWATFSWSNLETRWAPARPRCSTCWTSRPSLMGWSSSRCMITAAFTALRCWTSLKKPWTRGSWRAWGTSPVCVCRSATRCSPPSRLLLWGT